MTRTEMELVAGELKLDVNAMYKYDYVRQIQVTEYVIGEMNIAYEKAHEQRVSALDEPAADVMVQENNARFYGRKICGAVVDSKQISGATTWTVAPATNASVTDDISSLTSSFASTLTPHDPAPVCRREIWLGRQVDGFASTDVSRMEVKNRTHVFRRQVALHGRAELECYMQMYERDSDELVERRSWKVTEEEAQKCITRARKTNKKSEKENKEQSSATADTTTDASTNATATSVTVVATHVDRWRCTNTLYRDGDEWYIERLKPTVLKRNDDVWQHFILPSLQHFCNFLTHFLADEQMQVEYLKAQIQPKKDAILAPILPSIVPHLEYEKLASDDAVKDSDMRPKILPRIMERGRLSVTRS